MKQKSKPKKNFNLYTNTTQHGLLVEFEKQKWDKTDTVHALINCLVVVTPALGEVYSGHQPPMFSPSAESVLSMVTFSSS